MKRENEKTTRKGMNHPKVLPSHLSQEGARFPNGQLQGINPKLLPVNHPKVLPGLLSHEGARFPNG